MRKSIYEIGYYDETSDGPKWTALKTVKREHAGEAEAEVDQLKKLTPKTIDGESRPGLHIKRGAKSWFCRFSCHA